MTKLNLILLLAAEIALIVNLSINQDFVLAMLIALTQLVVVIVTLNFKSREEKAKELPIKKAAFTSVGVLLTIAPMLLFHQERFEPSSWSEAGLLLQGPFSILLIVFATLAAIISALASLYMRGKQ